MWFFKRNKEEKDDPIISKKIVQGNLKYNLDEEHKIASVVNFFNNNKVKEVIIPTSIKEGMFKLFFGKEYFVDTIDKKSFRFSSIKQIRFPKDSLVSTIEKGAFYRSSIESLYLPRSIFTLKDGWCKSTEFLINVEIDPENRFYSMQNGLLIGINEYYAFNGTIHKLFFANRNITQAVIPDGIKYILPYAFENCQKLETVEFESPYDILSIGKYAFSNCSSLKKFKFPYRIEKIEKFTFSGSFDFIESFEFDYQSCLKLIGEGAFMETKIRDFSLPRFVKKIEKSAFDGSFLRRFSVDYDSMLETIEAGSFSNSHIERLDLPKNFKKFEDGWCENTDCLNYLSVYKNPYYSECNDFIIGKSDEKSDVFDTIIFARRDIDNVLIPPFIRFISPFAFNWCREIESFEIQSNSKLEIIGESALSYSTIKKFVLPCNVTKICENAFASCKKLKFFEIENNSKLQVIDKAAFDSSSIVCFEIPSDVIEIGDSAFKYCDGLEIIEFNENTNMKSLNLMDLFNVGKTLIMIPANMKNIVH